MARTIYKEEQKYQLGYIFLVAALFIGALISLFYELWTNGQTVLPLYIELASLLVVGLLLLYMLRSRLVMKISPRKIKLKQYPAVWKGKSKIKLEEIEECIALKPSIAAEFSGWNIDFGFTNTFYKVCGQKGIALKLKNGETVFIESKKPGELKNLIDELKDQAAA